MSTNQVSGILPGPRTKVNYILKELVDHYKTPTYKLIRHLQTKYNCSLEEIGQVMGVSKQAVKFQYLSKFSKKDEINNVGIILEGEPKEEEEWKP